MKQVLFQAIALPLIAALFLLPVSAPQAREFETAYQVYLTGGEETLPQIAARPEYYGNPLAWPQILYLNRNELSPLLEEPETVARTPVRKGSLLAILLPGEARARAQEIIIEKDLAWTVNVAEAAAPEDLYEDAASIVAMGFVAYFAPGKGEKAVRLKAGFFPAREEAREAMERIAAKTGAKDPWISRAETDELEEFLGYMD